MRSRLGEDAEVEAAVGSAAVFDRLAHCASNTRLPSSSILTGSVAHASHTIAKLNRRTSRFGSGRIRVVMAHGLLSSLPVAPQERHVLIGSTPSRFQGGTT